LAKDQAIPDRLAVQSWELEGAGRVAGRLAVLPAGQVHAFGEGTPPASPGSKTAAGRRRLRGARGRLSPSTGLQAPKA